MNYELAKKLKDAGFPQNPHEHTERPDSWIDKDGELSNWLSGLEDEMYIPTLEELIEACGEEFVFLVREKDGTWTAVQEDVQKESGKGPTPSEAVANLWLSLHNNRNEPDSNGK